MGKRARKAEEDHNKRQKVVELDQPEPLENSFTRSLFDSEAGPKARNFLDLPLKPDHSNKAIWVTPDGRLYLETFSQQYKQAYDFLIAIAEPISRLRFIHEYELTQYSLYAAASVGLTGAAILEVLGRLSKVEIPPEVADFIFAMTDSFGQVSLVLRQNRYFLEAKQPKPLLDLQRHPAIRDAMVLSADHDKDTGLFNKSFILKHQRGAVALEGEDLDLDEDEEGGLDCHCFEVAKKQIEEIKRACGECDLPVLEEYDFKNDTSEDNPNIPIDLKPSTKLRPYQERSLAKMFGNGRARSGVIVLPCGAGKTLVGVTAASTVKKRVLVITSNGVSVDQWRMQFLQWTTMDERHICCFTASTKKEALRPNTHILVTTYQMITHEGARSGASTAMLEMVEKKEWGMLIMDEVHQAAADSFRKVIRVCSAHCKLGLTATLLREDDRIDDLNFLIGSKLYEANWLDLSRAGYIARVRCSEIWCEMTTEFFAAWLAKKDSPNKMRQLSIMNPSKFRACEYLIRHHEARNDKTIVFADDIFALQTYAKALNRIFIFGDTSHEERSAALGAFKFNPTVKTIFLSKIGDNAIDLPEANVLIQISSHFGSRRQEAQRLGRILRSKGKDKSEFNAYFYTLVSKYTEEMEYSHRRQRFLVNQGYSYNVITELPGMDTSTLMFESKEDQLQLLGKTLAAGCAAEVSADPATSQRRIGSSSSLSGGDSHRYSALYPRPGKSILPKRN